MGPYITADALKQSLADAIGVAVGSLDDAVYNGRFTRIVTDALASGYTDIANRLRVKGFTQGQIDNWDDRVRYTNDQSLFWCLVRCAEFGNHSDRDINKLDHRKELESPSFISLSINGTLQVPGATAAGRQVMVGTLTPQAGGIPYGEVFGLKVRSQGDKNSYGDPLWPGG